MTHPHHRPPILKGKRKMALGASVDLWHKRLHISPKRIQMIMTLELLRDSGYKASLRMAIVFAKPVKSPEPNDGTSRRCENVTLCVINLFIRRHLT